MRTTISYCASMGLATHERTLREALRRARRRTTSPDRDAHVRQLALDLFSRGDGSRRSSVATVVAIANDAFLRNAPHADVREFGVVYCAIVDAWYAGEVAPIRTLQELHLAEERAQGEKEAAEIGLAHNPTSPAAQLQFLEKSAAYDEANSALVHYVRQLSVSPRLVA